MVDVVRMDHPLEVAAPLRRPPSNPLVDNDIMKDQIKNSVAENSNAGRNAVWIVGDQAKIGDQCNRRCTENDKEPIVPFERVVMHRMMRPMPNPKDAVHNILVSEPGNEFPKQEHPDANQAAE
jgi:hypothetical protein